MLGRRTPEHGSARHNNRHGNIRTLALGTTLTVAALSACEKEAQPIPQDEYETVIDSTLASINRTAGFWSYRYDLLGIDRATVPDLRLTYDDDDASLLCDVLVNTEEGEMFLCNVDGKMVLNPKALHNLVLYVGLDPDNEAHLNAVTDVVTGHEFGHFLQRLLGTDQTKEVLVLELQADCLAGAQLAVAGYGQEISPEATTDALVLYQTILFAIGGDTEHGSSDMRVASFMSGHANGIPACIV